MHPVKWKKPCGARLFGQRKNANLCIKISVLLWRRVRDSNPRSLSGSQHFECCTFDLSDNSPKKMGPLFEDPFIIMPVALFCKAGNRNYSSEAMSTISMERRMNSVICSASSGWRDSSARS